MAGVKGQRQGIATAKALALMWETRKAEVSAKISKGQRAYWGSIRKVDPRNFYEYFIWRDAVYARDNSTCRNCGRAALEGKERHAHHIKDWDSYPELRFDVNNGLTLCSKCHYQQESNVRIEGVKQGLKSSIKGYVWITDGVLGSMLAIEKPIPSGWRLGRPKKSVV